MVLSSAILTCDFRRLVVPAEVTLSQNAPLRINGGSGDNAGLSSNGSPSHDPQSSNKDSSNGHSSFEPVDWFIFVVVNIGSSVNWILWKKDFYKTETEKLLGQMIAATWFCYAATFAVAYFLSGNRSHSGQNPHSRPNGP